MCLKCIMWAWVFFHMHFFYIFRTVCSVKEEDLHVYVVVNFLSQVIFVFLLFLGMVMYANEFETKFIRKLSNFNFQWTKTLYQNNFKHIAFFFTLFKGYKCNKLYEITPKKRFSLEPEKTNFKTFKFSHNEILLMRILDHFTRVFSIPVKFEICFLGLL